MAQRFDLGASRLLGEPVPIAGHNDASSTEITAFSVSNGGVLVYRAGAPAGSTRLVWRGRDGTQLGTQGQSANYGSVFLSPDERRASVTVNRDGIANLWVLEFASDVLSPLTFEIEPTLNPIWSPDSRRVAYQIYRRDHTTLLTLKLGEHSSKLLLDDGRLNFPDDWSPDGKWILGRRLVGKQMSVIIVPADGSAPPKVLFDAPALLDQLQFSPDGQWVAYNSIESGQWEVYAARFPSMTDTQQLSNAGGCQPVWRRDGQELFYLTQNGQMMSVPLTSGPTLQAAAPKMLFQTSLTVACSNTQYAADSSGQKFLLPERQQSKEPLEAREPLHIVSDWQAAFGTIGSQNRAHRTR
jgi:hypothetical protein